MVEIDGEPWFVASDACKILGYRQAASYYTQKLDGNERRVVTRREVSQFKLETSIFSGPSAPSATLISESGLYKLVMRSDKKEAKTFQNWVTRGFSMGKSIYSGCLPKSGIDPHNRTKKASKGHAELLAEDDKQRIGNPLSGQGR